MKNHAPVKGLSDVERTMLIAGRRALRKERGKRDDHSGPRERGNECGLPEVVARSPQRWRQSQGILDIHDQ